MASDQQFCLRWNNHQSTLVSVFDNLLESQTLVDCTLAADGQYLKAHKVVLSACSPYLEAILCQNMDKHPILILKDVKFAELKAMLDYMYRGEVNISQEQLSTFLKAAESLQIKGLTDSGGGGGGGGSDRDLLKRQELRKPLNQPVPHIPQPRPVVPHPGLLEPRRSLPHFPPHIADMQPQSPRHAREGSTSPTARKRRRPNRPSSDDSNFVSTPNSLSENQPDTSDSCDLPVKQTATPSNVPNPATKAPETDPPRQLTPQPQQNSEKPVVVKKEFTETLLTPKTEFDYGNDNSMEDVAYEDEEDEEVDLSKPGTSFAANSQGFSPWQMGGDGSNEDSNNIYSADVTATTPNNSQDRNSKVNNMWGLSSRAGVTDSAVATVSGQHGKNFLCFKCHQYVHKRIWRLHSKYYCEKVQDESEWGLSGSSALCKTCNKAQRPDSIEFHVKYLCKKKPITVQCFYCPQLFKEYRGLLAHIAIIHKKRHRFQDLLSILPPADSITKKSTPVKVVRHCINTSSLLEAESFLEHEDQDCSDPKVHIRKKTYHKCKKCGKELLGIHTYQNHINTKCESEEQYTCFYCAFKATYIFEVLDHMEDMHRAQYNTYDVIQAHMSGIIPDLKNSTRDPASDVNIAQQDRIEPHSSTDAVMEPLRAGTQICKTIA